MAYVSKRRRSDTPGMTKHFPTMMDKVAKAEAIKEWRLAVASDPRNWHRSALGRVYLADPKTGRVITGEKPPLGVARTLRHALRPGKR